MHELNFIASRDSRDELTFAVVHAKIQSEIYNAEHPVSALLDAVKRAVT